MYANELFEELKNTHKLKNDAEIAKLIGLTSARISQMRKSEHPISAKQIVSYMTKAEARGRELAFIDPVRPIVEMYPIDAVLSKQERKWEVLPTGKINIRNQAIREHLESAQGIYLLYDSLGRAIYAGKTEKQGMWREINSAFNRERSNHQATFVDHPTTGASFLPAWKSPRQPISRMVCLFSTAHYFSAYEVTFDLISDLEALLVRGFANNISNKKMEKFSSFAKKAVG